MRQMWKSEKNYYAIDIYSQAVDISTVGRHSLIVKFTTASLHE